MGLDRLPDILLMLLGFGSILFLAFITTRYVGNRAGKAMRGKHVTIIETVSLGMDKRLHLVKAGDQYLLLASTSKSLEFITEIKLGDEEQAVGTGDSSGLANVFDFKVFFEKYSGLYKNKSRSKADTASGQKEAEPNTGKPEGVKFKNNLDRLMNITRELDQTGSKNGDDFTNEK